MSEDKVCKWCANTGYDASGLRCTCYTDPFKDMWLNLCRWFTKLFKGKNNDGSIS